MQPEICPHRPCRQAAEELARAGYRKEDVREYFVGNMAKRGVRGPDPPHHQSMIYWGHVTLADVRAKLEESTTTTASRCSSLPNTFVSSLPRGRHNGWWGAYCQGGGQAEHVCNPPNPGCRDNPPRRAWPATTLAAIHVLGTAGFVELPDGYRVSSVRVGEAGCASDTARLLTMSFPPYANTCPFSPTTPR